MSRLNQIIQSCRQRSATLPSSTVAPPATDAIRIPEAGTAEDHLPEIGNPLDQLKPKIKEILDEIKKEEEKLCSDAKSLNPTDIVHRIPVLARLAHNLPDPLRARIKAALAKLFPQVENCNPVEKKDAPEKEFKLCNVPIPGPSTPIKEPPLGNGLVDGPIPAPAPAVVTPANIEAN